MTGSDHSGSESTSAPDTKMVELGEWARKGTHVMPELSIPADYDPPTAAPLAPAPPAAPAPSAPSEAPSGGGGAPTADE